MKWVAHDIRDAVVDFMAYWSARTELPARRWLGWLEFSPRKFERWQERYGKANEHNGLVPRDHWLEEWEKEAILAFFARYPLEGYRRLAFMMLDADVVAVSPSSVYRVLRAAGLIAGRFSKTSHKGKGFVQPLAPHDHWHVDFSYLNIGLSCAKMQKRGCVRFPHSTIQQPTSVLRQGTTAGKSPFASRRGGLRPF